MSLSELLSCFQVTGTRLTAKLRAAGERYYCRDHAMSMHKVLKQSKTNTDSRNKVELDTARRQFRLGYYFKSVVETDA